MKDPVVKLLVAFLMAVLVLWGCSLFFASCKVLKSKQETQKATVKTDTSSAGRVSEATKMTNTDWEWFKNTLLYMQQPKSGDTTITKNYFTVPTSQPQVIIMEGGKGQQVVNERSRDSIWEQRLSRMEELLIERIKHKDVEGFTTMQLIGAAILVIAISVLASKLTFKK